jgi:hypothetical protein
MAIREIIESDISGKAGAATATFGLGDTWYEVDLTEDEQKQLEKALQPYLKAGRKATDKAPGKPNRFVPETTAEERQKIREWAKKQDNLPEFHDRGKIPNNIYFAYQEAHGKDPAGGKSSRPSLSSV